MSILDCVHTRGLNESLSIHFFMLTMLDILKPVAGGLYGGASIIKSRLLPWLGTGFFTGGTADTSLSVIAEASSKNRELQELQDMYENSLKELEQDLQTKELENQDLRDE